MIISFFRQVSKKENNTSRRRRRPAVVSIKSTHAYPLIRIKFSFSIYDLI